MKKYVLVRILRSILSLLVVTVIVFAMIFTMIPRARVFKADSTFGKLASKPDALEAYKNLTYKKLGYIDYVEQKDICLMLSKEENANYEVCMTSNSKIVEEYTKKQVAKGYTLGNYETTGLVYLKREKPILTRVASWLSKLVKIDNPFAIKDEANPDLKRNYYLGKTPNGLPALACSGCEYKYQVYFNGSFPFIHSNTISFDFGTSFPSFANQPVLDVVTQPQGEVVKKDVTFPTGVKQSSGVNLYSCKYKYTLDNLDTDKFTDNYADCHQYKQTESMISISAFFGIISLILTYALALPIGIFMASKKDKWADKLGMAYIVFTIAIPGLAFIYTFKFLGSAYFGLPDKFPMMGSGAWQSYVLPIISLTLPAMGGVMMWVRRYMIDQSTQDYVKFARAKGLSQQEIFRTHIFKNAIIPIVHAVPSSIVAVISGALITETVYAVPGMGKMLPDAINAYNNNVVVALAFIFTGVSIFAILAGDILITYIDPRISLTDDGGRK